MKTVVLMAVAWALAAAVSHGQTDAFEAHSGEAYKSMMKQMFDQERVVGRPVRNWNTDLEVGRSLFGADERWKARECGQPPELSMSDDLNGTLADKRPSAFKIGDWGFTSESFKSISKVSDTECLVLPIDYKVVYDVRIRSDLRPRPRFSEVMLLRGLDMAKVTDGVQFILQYPLVIQSTTS